MKRWPIMIIIACLTGSANAQNSICLPAGETPNSIVFNADEVNGYLRLEQYKAVFYGEQHNNHFDPEIKYHLITGLNKYYGFRHIFMEIGYAESYLYNRYLATGDTTLFTHPKLIFSSPYYVKFWQRLYEYNKVLPDNRKIMIHGLDFERTDVYKVIQLLAPADQEIPEALKPVMDTVAAHRLDSLKMYAEKDGKLSGLADNSSFKNRLKYIRAQFLANAAAGKAFFGPNYPLLEGILHNKSEVTVRPRPRNKTMFDNMKRIIESEKIERFIGFFGAAHVQYREPSAMVNRARELPGMEAKDILNMVEAVYHVKAAEPDKRTEMLKAINGNCKATILPATEVPGYRQWADFVIVADNKE